MNRFFLLPIAIVIVLSACNGGINETIYVEDGETRNSSLNSVNGNIIIGDNCTVHGGARTVNGRIEVGRNSSVEDLQSVNGRIRVAEDSEVNGDLEVVNGSVTCGTGVKIDGQVKTINGRIDLERVDVRRDVKTHNGDIRLTDNTNVGGDVIIEGEADRFGDHNRLKIEISNSVVEGDIIVEDRDRDVRVYLSNDGRVLGKIKNAEVIKE